MLRLLRITGLGQLLEQARLLDSLVSSCRFDTLVGGEFKEIGEKLSLSQSIAEPQKAAVWLQTAPPVIAALT